MKVVLASNNAGKIRELNALLNHLDINLVPQAALNVDEIEETGLTFIENAILKARHAAHITGLPAIADDSGLVVKALNGAPGIYSARYAGKEGDASLNIKKLLVDLESIPDDAREAYFYCVLVFISHANDPIPLVCTGKWAGTILRQPKGNDGFGYDPIFYVPEQKKTAAELTPDIKNKLSHRSIALQNLLSLLPDKI